MRRNVLSGAVAGGVGVLLALAGCGSGTTSATMPSGSTSESSGASSSGASSTSPDTSTSSPADSSSSTSASAAATPTATTALQPTTPTHGFEETVTMEDGGTVWVAAGYNRSAALNFRIKNSAGPIVVDATYGKDRRPAVGLAEKAPKEVESNGFAIWIGSFRIEPDADMSTMTVMVKVGKNTQVTFTGKPTRTY